MEILRFALRFQMARPHHLVAWTGASPYTVRDRLTQLTAAKLLTRTPVSVDLREADGSISETLAYVLQATGAGAVRAGEWVVPGTQTASTPEGVRVSLPARRASSLTSHHALGVADLACWYRTYGYQVAAEREIRSLEQTGNLKGARAAISAWSVTIPGRPGIHPPDLGVVHPDGGMWAVELERATKSVQEYTAVIGAYRAAGLGQVWHVMSSATGKRLMEAATRNGLVWGPPPLAGVVADTPDGLVRFQGWVPGRASLTDPKRWAKQMPPHPPAAIPVGDLPDLTLTWRKKVPKDVNGVNVDDTSGRWM